MSIVINEGDCFDPAWFSDAFDALNGLHAKTKNGRVQVYCTSLAGSLPFRATAGESCTTLIDTGSIPTLKPGQSIECCLLYNFNGVFYINQSPGSQTITGTIKCNGVSQYTQNMLGTGTGALTIDCDRNSKIELCVTASFNSLDDEVLSARGGLEICGCMICFITEQYNSHRSVFIPTEVKPECCYGIDAMALIGQNLNGLREYFINPGYLVRCVDVSGPTESVLSVAEDLENPTKWIAIGCTKIEYLGLFNGDGISATAQGGCEGNYVTCPKQTFTRTWGGEPNGLGGGSHEFGHVLCGSCKPGDSLFMQSIPQMECSSQTFPDLTETYEPRIAEATTEYCVYLFEQIDYTEQIPPVPYLKHSCVDMEFGQGVTETCAAIDTIASEFEPPDKSIICKTGTIADGVPFMIIPPAPDIWTPQGLPIPSKKRSFMGLIVASAIPQNMSTEEESYTRWTFSLSCGGESRFGGQAIWRTQGNGGFNANAIPQSICGCFDCLVTDPVFLTPFAQHVYGRTYVVEFSFFACSVCFF